jgi:hypothetical protein
MKIEITALVTYHNDKIIGVRPIRDSDDDAHVNYPRSAMSFDEFAVAVTRLYYDDEIIGRKLREYLEGKLDVLTLDGPAAMLPCIGQVRVQCEVKAFDWEWPL